MPAARCQKSGFKIHSTNEFKSSVIALRSSRREKGKLMAAHMKFFLSCGGRSNIFPVVYTFAEVNE